MTDAVTGGRSRERPVLAVGGVLVAGGGDAASVLLIRRGHPPNQGSWTLPGGRVERGESLEQALVREMREETGLEVGIGPLLLVAELIADDHHYVVLDYACERRSGELRAGDDAASAELVRVTELGARGVTEAVREAVRRAFTTR